MINKTIKVDTLARVEGEGALFIKLAGERLLDVKLKIYEPPRFFEAFLRGRRYEELPDITARICGICPVAYQMSAVLAAEQAFGVTVEPRIKALRRLLYCGEWIESHALHIYLLHAPDFLGYEDGIALAADHPEKVKAGLEAKKAGNELMTVIGGREIHPVSLCVGGFYKAPAKRDLQALLDPLRRARDIAVETVRWVKDFDFPGFAQDYEFVSLRAPGEYPICEGRLVSNKGLDIAIDDYLDHFVEKHVSYSNALHSILRARGSYHVGPLARFNLNFDRLPESIQQLAVESGVGVPCLNPFQSIVVRGLELLYACEEALRIIEEYEPPEIARVPVEAKAAAGNGCTEAPRGILYHRYEFDGTGCVKSARIVPPTAQNQKRIEEDLRAFIPQLIGQADGEVTWRCEQAVRNYDPCISCATHAVKVRIEREP
jgi:sulfhydrogenase subunit alpha